MHDAPKSLYFCSKCGARYRATTLSGHFRCDCKFKLESEIKAVKRTGWALLERCYTMRVDIEGGGDAMMHFENALAKLDKV